MTQSQRDCQYQWVSWLWLDKLLLTSRSNWQAWQHYGMMSLWTREEWSPARPHCHAAAAVCLFSPLTHKATVLHTQSVDPLSSMLLLSLTAVQLWTLDWCVKSSQDQMLFTVSPQGLTSCSERSYFLQARRSEMMEENETLHMRGLPTVSLPGI